LNRKGAVLVEVLAAMVIVAIAGVGTLGALALLWDSESLVFDRELEVQRAANLITEISSLNGEELALRLGFRREGDFAAWIDRPEPSLYRIGVASANQPEAEILVTLLYRPDPPTSGRGR